MTKIGVFRAAQRSDKMSVGTSCSSANVRFQQRKKQQFYFSLNPTGSKSTNGF